MIDKNNEYWSKADDVAADLEILQLFSETNSESESKPKPEIELESALNKNMDLDSQVKVFWSCFEDSINNNKRGDEGQRRLLSIIAEDFTYLKLNKELKVSNNLINTVRLLYSHTLGTKDFW
jgi:hypothetical protein